MGGEGLMCIEEGQIKNLDFLVDIMNGCPLNIF